MQQIKNKILNGKHKPILYDVFYKETQTKKPLVIFCHGFKGYKDWGSWNIMANYFAENNFFFVKFNFSFNGGTVKNPIDFPDLEAFSQNNFTKELDDLQTILDYFCKSNPYLNEIDTNNITLIGHSRGAGVITLKANEDKRVTNVISWCGISDIEARFPKGELLTAWQKNKIAYIENSRTKQQMPLHIQFYENFMANKERLTIKNAVKNLKASHLIVYGSKDTVVLPAEAENLHKWNPKSELFLVENMNHGLDNTQPYLAKEMPKNLKTVVDKTIKFISKK